MRSSLNTSLQQQPITNTDIDTLALDAEPQLLDPRAAARAAGLRYVADTVPGIRRRRAGRAFTYRGPDGTTIRDQDTLARIRRLAVPPAWTDVWICPFANRHVQATRRHAPGRQQYRY